MMLRAPPAWNHSICSAFIVWVHAKSTVEPSGFVISHATGVSGARSARPRIEMRSSSPIWSYVCGVGERQRQHALLLEVGLGDAGERAADHGLGVAEPGLHGGVLARRALAVVLVADGHPALAGLVVVLGDVGEGLGLAVELVLARCRPRR